MRHGRCQWECQLLNPMSLEMGWQGTRRPGAHAHWSVRFQQGLIVAGIGRAAADNAAAAAAGAGLREVGASCIVLFGFPRGRCRCDQ